MRLTGPTKHQLTVYIVFRRALKITRPSVPSMRRQLSKPRMRPSAIATRVTRQFALSMPLKPTWSGCLFDAVREPWVSSIPHPLRKLLNGVHWPRSSCLIRASRTDPKNPPFETVRLHALRCRERERVDFVFYAAFSLGMLILVDIERFGFTFDARNVGAYGRGRLKNQIERIAAELRAEANDPQYTMIGKNIDILRSAFNASKAAGKTWQIWGAATSKNMWNQKPGCNVCADGSPV
jgi:hypothetical protein